MIRIRSICPNNLSKDDYSRKGYHHWFCTRPGRTMNLRAVAVGFCPLNSTFWPILTEGIIIVLLGTLSDKGQRKQFTPKAMFDSLPWAVRPGSGLEALLGSP
jgi:hypothetical protein